MLRRWRKSFPLSAVDPALSVAAPCSRSRLPCNGGSTPSRAASQMSGNDLTLRACRGAAPEGYLCRDTARPAWCVFERSRLWRVGSGTSGCMVLRCSANQATASGTSASTLSPQNAHVVVTRCCCDQSSKSGPSARGSPRLSTMPAFFGRADRLLEELPFHAVRRRFLRPGGEEECPASLRCAQLP
jgi:hypothetical protein